MKTVAAGSLLFLLGACAGGISGSERIDRALAQTEPGCTASAGPLEGKQCAAHSRCQWSQTIGQMRAARDPNIDAAEKSAAADQVFCEALSSGRITASEFRLKRAEETLSRHRVIEERERGMRIETAADAELLDGPFYGGRRFHPYW